MKRTMLIGLTVFSVAAGVAYGDPPYTRFVTGFEEPGQPGEEFSGGFLSGVEVVWQEPHWSGTTRGIGVSDSECQVADCSVDTFGNPWDDSQVVREYDPEIHWGPSAYTGYQSYMMYWVWSDAANTSGIDAVRATTLAADYLDHPAIHLRGKVTFRMAVLAYEYDAASNDLGAPVTTGAYVRMAMGVTESGNAYPMGWSDPGSSGAGIEWVYPNDIDTSGVADYVPPASTNGAMWPPHGKRYEATANWPPCNGLETDNLNPCFGMPDDWHAVEFDLSDPNLIVRALAGDSADGILDATSNGDGEQRGILESLTLTNDPDDTTGRVFFVYIDDLEFEAPEPDPVFPPVILTPVNAGDTEVALQCEVGANEAELWVNDVSIGTAVPDAGTGVATFTSAEGLPVPLEEGWLLKAKQTKDGVTSDFSRVIVVFSAGVVLAENFDDYASQAELEEWWSQTDAENDRKLLLTSGGAASCENMVVSDYDSGSTVSKLYRSIGAVNGSDEEPLTVLYQFKHDSNSGSGRARFELAPELSKTYGAVGYAFSNGPGDQWATQYTSMTNSPTGELPDGYVSDYFWYDYARTGIDREANVWHEMKIVITSDYYNFYIDDELANPVNSNGEPYPANSNGVPRANKGASYKYVMLGVGYSNNGPAMMYDDIVVMVGTNAVSPFGDLPPAPPTLPEILYPGQTLITLTDVTTNALTVEVFAEFGLPAIGSLAGPFPGGTADVTVSALSPAASITTKQTIGGVTSCHSAPVIVTDSTVLTEYEMEPTLADLSLAISADDLLNGRIGVAEGGDVDPANGVIAWNLNSGAGCLEIVGTQPSPGFHAATPGGQAGGLVDLTDGVEGAVVEAVLADYNHASLVVRYDFPVPISIEEIVVFAANEDPGATNNGRLFQNYDVYVSTNGMASFEPLATQVTSGGFGYLNLDDDRATLTRVYDAVSMLATKVTNLRFVFYCGSNTGGRFHDQWAGNYNEDPTFQANCPDEEPEDIDGYRRAFEAPIIKEIDVFGRWPGDYDEDGDVDLDDYTAFGECLFGPDVAPNPITPPPTAADCLEFFDFDEDSDVDLDDFAVFQLAYTG